LFLDRLDPANLNSVLDRLQFVRGLALDPTLASAIHPDRFRQFVREGAIAPAFLLSDYFPRRRRATLVAQMLDLECRLSDAGLELFEKLIGSFFTRARRRHDQRYQATAREVGQLMGLFDRTISALSDSIERGVDPIEVINETIGWHRLLEAQPKVAALASLANEDPLIGATDKYASLRRFGPAFLETFAFRASKGGRTIVAAVDLLRDLNKSGRREVPPDAPMPFQPASWRKIVLDGDGNLNRRRWETAVMASLRGGLRSGDVWVDGARNYQKFDAYLLPGSDVRADGSELPIEGGVETYVADRGRLLDARLRRFSSLLRRGRLEGVEIRQDELHVAANTAVTPPAAEALDREIDGLLPLVRITELLKEVDDRTGFVSRFTELRSGRQHDNPSAVMAALLADATNLGLERMANASEGVSYAQLAWTHTWYLRPETYQAALAAIVDAQIKHPFAAVWGDGTSSSSDGQFFRTGRRSGDINAKYGQEPGLKLYTHLTGQYASFHSRVISATMSEAPYVLDGLLAHGTGVTTKEHYVDTGGATDHVFALCHLLGLRFVPQLRDLHDRRLAILQTEEPYRGLESLIGRPIRADVIRENWSDILRLGASIKAGAVAPSAMLRKLAAYQRTRPVMARIGMGWQGSVSAVEG
jgi:hypothetical protein